MKIAARGGAAGCWEIRRAKLLAGVGTGALALAMSAGAATAQTWTGTTSNDWTVGTNWSSGTVPTGAVIIDTQSPNPTVLGVGGAAIGTATGTTIGSTNGSSANLTIQNGSTLTTNGAARIGSNAGSNGTVTVTGPGSQWRTTGTFYVGFSGTGTLNIENGATVVTEIGARLTNATGSGTLNISGGSTLETNFLRKTNGAAQVNFDDAILKARNDSAFFLFGFSGTQLNIAEGGLIIDTGAFNLDADATSALTGVGGLTVTGTGRLNLAANNGYAGETFIQSGTLALIGAGSIASSSRVVADGTFDISGVTAGDSSIQSLAGSGAVTLGTKTLIITDANDVFSGVIGGDGGLTITGGTQTLTGANTYTGGTTISGGTLAVSSDGALGDVAGALTFNGGGLRALASFENTRDMHFAGVGGFDVDAGVELTLSGTLDGAGSLIKIGVGTLVQNSARNYAGQTLILDGALRAGAANVFGGIYSLNSTTATLDLNGFDQTISDLQNFGSVRFGSAPGTTLTITETYDGFGGGFVYLNIALGDDSSVTDLLDVQGDTAGTTSLVVTNVGGAGAQTTEGIKVVNVGGASNGTFSLVGDYVYEGEQAVVGGAYAYRLYQGSVSDPGDGDWYLRSELDNALLFQAGVPVYEAYPGVLQSFNQLGTLQQRLGNRSWTVVAQGADAISEEAAVSPGVGIWGQIEGGYGEFDPETSTTGTSYDVAIWRLKAGVDTVLTETASGQLIGGAAVHFGTASSDISSIFGDGSIDATGYGVSGSLTWYGNTGFYADAQAQVTGYDSDLSSDTAGVGLVEGNDGLGYALGVELGQRIPITPEWALTPQAQLAWSSVDFDDFEDAFGAEVSLDSGDSLIGRLGLAVDRQTEWLEADGTTSRTHLYGIGNLYYDFEDGTSVDVAGTPVDSEVDALWAGLGLGGTYAWADDRYSLYGEASAKSQLDDFGDSYAIGGTVGFKMTW